MNSIEEHSAFTTDSVNKAYYNVEMREMSSSIRVSSNKKQGELLQRQEYIELLKELNMDCCPAFYYVF